MRRHAARVKKSGTTARARSGGNIAFAKHASGMAQEYPKDESVLMNLVEYDDFYDCYFSLDILNRKVCCIPYHLSEKARGRRYWIFFTPRVFTQIETPIIGVIKQFNRAWREPVARLKRQGGRLAVTVACPSCIHTFPEKSTGLC